MPIGKVMLDRNQIMSSRRGMYPCPSFGFFYSITSFFLFTGIEQWFPLKPIIKDEEIQGELLVEVMLDEFSEVSISVSWTCRFKTITHFLFPLLGVSSWGGHPGGSQVHLDHSLAFVLSGVWHLL